MEHLLPQLALVLVVVGTLSLAWSSLPKLEGLSRSEIGGLVEECHLFPPGLPVPNAALRFSGWWRRYFLRLLLLVALNAGVLISFWSTPWLPAIIVGVLLIELVALGVLSKRSRRACQNNIADCRRLKNLAPQILHCGFKGAEAVKKGSKAQRITVRDWTSSTFFNLILSPAVAKKYLTPTSYETITVLWRPWKNKHDERYGDGQIVAIYLRDIAQLPKEEKALHHPNDQDLVEMKIASASWL